MIQLTFKKVYYYDIIVDSTCCIEMRTALDCKIFALGGLRDKLHIELSTTELEQRASGERLYNRPVTICPFCGVKVTIHGNVKEAT